MDVSLARVSIVVVAAALAITAPTVAGGENAPGSTSKPDYQGTGVIVGLHPAPSSLHATRPVIVLRHDPIVGLMDESMEHPFIVASTELFKGLKPGDQVDFEMKSTDDALLVISMRPAKPPRRR